MKKIWVRITTVFIVLGTFFTILGLSKDGFKDENLNKSLEFQGGYEMLVQVDSTATVTEEQLVDVAASISARVDSLGVQNPQIDVEPEVQAIRITLAGLNSTADQEEAEALVTRPGSVTFRDRSSTLLMNGDVIAENGASLSYSQTGEPIVSLRIADNDTFGDVTEALSTAEAPDNQLVTWIDFDQAWEIAQETLPNITASEMFGYAVGDVGGIGIDYVIPSMQPYLISYANVNERLDGDATISGNFSDEDARGLAELINSGSFDYDLNLLESNVVPATFGAGAFNQSIVAGVIGFSLISVFMVMIYGIFGVISAVTLGIYLIMTLIAFNAMGGEYGPDSIAALVIGLGMAVDANIITFERIKDEIYRGRKVTRSIESGSRKTLSTILDGNITTFIAGYILFIFGTRSVKGFSITLILSIFFTLVITVFVSRLLVSAIVKSEWFNKNKTKANGRLLGINPAMIKEVPEGELSEDRIFKNTDIIKQGNKFAIGSLVILVIGMVSLLFRGANLGMDFTGGTRLTLEVNDLTEEFVSNSSDYDEIINNIQEIDGFVVEDYQVVEGVRIDADGDEVLDDDGETIDQWRLVLYLPASFDLQAEENSGSQLAVAYSDLIDENDELFEYSRSSISPQVAAQLANNAFMATSIASLFIILYVSFRFKWSYAVAAIVALAHDVLIVLAIFIVFKIEINITFISAILAIIGYSINDTIVTFDRTREIINDMSVQGVKRKLNKGELKWAINKALKQTIIRSFFTTVTTMLAVLALLVFGSSASLNFNIALFIGLVVGTYSSIFISSKVWLWLETIRQERLNPNKSRVKRLPGIQEQIFKGIND